MTAAPAQWTPPPPQQSPWSAGRIVALVLGVLFLLPAIALVLAGGVLLWADQGNRSDGFVVSPVESFSSGGYALVSDRIDLATGADWLPVSASLGTARVEVTGRGPTDDVFVGIAPASDVTAYLGGVQRTRIDNLGFDQPASSNDQLPGGAPSGPPTDQGFWTAQTSGPGTQQLTWDPTQGSWMLVVMNTDASAGVAVQARIGAEFPALSGLAWGLLIAGLLILVGAVVLLTLAIRRRPQPAVPTGPPPAYPAAGPPPVPAPRPSTEWGAPSPDRPAPYGPEPRSGPPA